MHSASFAEMLKKDASNLSIAAILPERAGRPWYPVGHLKNRCQFNSVWKLERHVLTGWNLRMSSRAWRKNEKSERREYIVTNKLKLPRQKWVPKRNRACRVCKSAAESWNRYRSHYKLLKIIQERCSLKIFVLIMQAVNQHFWLLILAISGNHVRRGEVLQMFISEMLAYGQKKRKKPEEVLLHFWSIFLLCG